MRPPPHLPEEQHTERIGQCYPSVAATFLSVSDPDHLKALVGTPRNSESAPKKYSAVLTEAHFSCAKTKLLAGNNKNWMRVFR